MSLRETLGNIRKQAAANIPDEAREVMRRATTRLAESGQIESALGVGERLPAFALKDHEEIVHSSAELLVRAPLVLQFYRGYW